MCHAVVIFQFSPQLHFYFIFLEVPTNSPDAHDSPRMCKAVSEQTRSQTGYNGKD